MTINEIAKLSGVSKSTVSRVLNNEKGVSKKAKDSVQAVVKEHNFVLNRAASMTKKNKSVFLVLATRLDSYSETRLIRGMMAKEPEVEFLITETQFSIEKTKEIINNNKSVSGIIIFAISNEDYSFTNDLMLPVVTIGQKLDYCDYNYYFPDYESLDYVCSNNEITNPLFLGYNENDITMMQRYEAVNNHTAKPLQHVKMDSYGHIDINDINGEYNTFICATDTIALITYKYILNKNIKDYKIIIVGNNLKLNFIIDNKITINFHYKDAGMTIIENFIKHKPFKICGDYTINK